MARSGEGEREYAHGTVMFPPALVPVLHTIAKGYGVLLPLAEEDLEELFTSAFFAGLRTEEGEHHPLRIVIMPAVDLTLGRSSPAGWHLFRFRSPVAYDPRQLVRLARAVRSERLFLAVTRKSQLLIVGLARESAEPNGATLKLVVTEPGSLELWIGHRRLLDYAQGRIVEAPENVLLAAGRVRSRLLQLSFATKLPEYVESVTALIRHIAAHPYGGILIVSSEEPATPSTEASFLFERGPSIGAVLGQLATVQAIASPAQTLLSESLRAELVRTLAEVGRLSALDGATILDMALNVLGFGVILPILDNVVVLAAGDAAASALASFPLHQYGARHRAAASYASMHPGSLVFVASADGAMACMLREPAQVHVTIWRFRSGDLLR